ncbi:TetR/AcrR family transcriptional regulator [Pseudomonas sp. Snoq117.2]|uniref:TetR/AcrR family transcriptional regulator n=1 Tax=Pseudomonas sp. Snoq117.2 TaxID=1500302 RepID=UPI0008B2370D|nr:TetR family transcriptional regulator [Pseudomonas sp. Snoq117.2]SEP06985.1 transcriptional regulator, TetR family [Pseudomonas sp. Snoq117.2]
MAWPLDQRVQTRQRILESAARLFALRGFDAVGLDDLMADAGLTRGAFYHHFRTKTEVYDQAIAHAAQVGSARLDSLGGSGLGQLVEHYLSREHAEGDSLRCPLAFLAADVTHREAAIRGSYMHFFARFVSRLERDLSGPPAQRRARALQLATTLIGGVALDDEGLAEELLAACRQGGQGLLEEGDDLAAAAG